MTRLSSQIVMYIYWEQLQILNHQLIPQTYRIFMVPQAMPQATIGNLSSPLRFLCAAHDTCGCRLANNKPCSTLFGSEYYVQMRAQASLLARKQLDMVLLGSVMSTLMDGDVASGRHKPAKRQRTTIHFMHRGYHLCRATFTFLYGISKHRLKAIKDSCLKDGLAPRTHGNTKKTPHNALCYDMIINIMKFMQNFLNKMRFCYQVVFLLLKGTILKYFHHLIARRYSTI